LGDVQLLLQKKTHDALGSFLTEQVSESPDQEPVVLDLCSYRSKHHERKGGGRKKVLQDFVAKREG